MTKWPFNHKSLATSVAAAARLSPTALEIGKTTGLPLLQITDIRDDVMHLKQVVSVGLVVGGGAYTADGLHVVHVFFLDFLLKEQHKSLISPVLLLNSSSSCCSHVFSLF